MISKKYYQELLSPDPYKRDKNISLLDFFDYVIDSKINGNYTQVREFIKRMSADQHRQFIRYIQHFHNLRVKDCYLKEVV